jgi:hypothetical protein
MRDLEKAFVGVNWKPSEISKETESRVDYYRLSVLRVIDADYDIISLSLTIK